MEGEAGNRSDSGDRVDLSDSDAVLSEDLETGYLIMNSRLSAGERYDQMMRAKAGEDGCDDRTAIGAFYSFSESGTDRD